MTLGCLVPWYLFWSALLRDCKLFEILFMLVLATSIAVSIKHQSGICSSVCPVFLIVMQLLCSYDISITAEFCLGSCFLLHGIGCRVVLDFGSVSCQNPAIFANMGGQSLCRISDFGRICKMSLFLQSV